MSKEEKEKEDVLRQRLEEARQQVAAIEKTLEERSELRAYVDSLKEALDSGDLERVRKLREAEAVKPKTPKNLISVKQLPLELEQKAEAEGLYGRPPEYGLKSTAYSIYSRPGYSAAKRIQDALLEEIKYGEGRDKYEVYITPEFHHTGDVIVYAKKGTGAVWGQIHLCLHEEVLARPQAKRIANRRWREGLEIPFKTMKFKVREAPKNRLTIHCVGFHDGRYMLLTQADVLKQLKKLDNASNMYTIHLGAKEMEELTANVFALLKDI